MVSLKIPNFISGSGDEPSGGTGSARDIELAQAGHGNGAGYSPGAAAGVGAAETAPAPTVIGNSAKQRELEELLLKLDLMEKECIQEKLDEEREALKDDFVAIRRQVYKSLMEIRELIRTRHNIQMAQGNSVEVIQKGALIESKFKELDTVIFTNLKETFKRQLKQKGKKYSEDVLDQRFQELQLIKQQMDEARRLFKNAATMSVAEVQNLTDFKAARPNLLGGGGGSEWREMNEDERAVVERWQQRDEDIDRQVMEIGDAIDRLGQVAIQIGEKADRQAELVAGLHHKADDANEELLAVNNMIRSILQSQNSFNFVCKLVLSLILVALIGFIMSGIQKRISLG